MLSSVYRLGGGGRYDSRSSNLGQFSWFCTVLNVLGETGFGYGVACCICFG